MKKGFLESISFGVVCVIGVALCILGLKVLDTYEKNRALDRCYPYGITESYTNQGKVYYTCKVEK